MSSMEAVDVPAKRTRSSSRHLQKITIKNQQKSIWLPTECWVDTLKLLSRRQLLQRVQPTCRRLHAISEQHVHTHHVFTRFGRFLQFLASHNFSDEPEICNSLNRHFRLGAQNSFTLRQSREKTQQNYSRILDIVLRRCPDLCRNCLLLICFADDLSPEGPSNLDYLAQLGHLRPQFVCLGFEVHPEDELLQQPVVLNTPHLSLTSQDANVAPSAEAICHWLHHRPEAAAGEEITTTRIFQFPSKMWNIPGNVQSIAEGCKKTLQQAKTVNDRRAFLFIFNIYFWNCDPAEFALFRMDNPDTDEVLQLEKRILQDDEEGEEGAVRVIYALRRCLKVDLARADQFYRETMEQMGVFGAAKKDGQKLPILAIH